MSALCELEQTFESHASDSLERERRDLASNLVQKSAISDIVMKRFREKEENVTAAQSDSLWEISCE